MAGDGYIGRLCRTEPTAAMAGGCVKTHVDVHFRGLHTLRRMPRTRHSAI